MAHPALGETEAAQVPLELLDRVQPAKRHRRPVWDARTQASRSRLVGDLAEAEHNRSRSYLRLPDLALEVWSPSAVKLGSTPAWPNVVQVVEIGADYHGCPQPRGNRAYRLEQMRLAEKTPVGGVCQVGGIFELPSFHFNMQYSMFEDKPADKVKLISRK